MSDEIYQIPELPEEIDVAYRKAHRALEVIWPQGGGFFPEAKLQSTHDVIAQFASLADKATMTVAAYLGPAISWEANQRHAQFELTTAGIDFTDDRHSFGVKLRVSSVEGRSDEWSGSQLDLAAGIYRREAGWDFRPSDSGMWLLMLAPESGYDTDYEWVYSGHLAGFVIFVRSRSRRTIRIGCPHVDCARMAPPGDCPKPAPRGSVSI